MSSAHRSLGTLGPSLLAAALLGCANGPIATLRPFGFLGDYASFHPAEHGESRYVAIDPAAKFDRYDSVMLDSVTVWVADESHASRPDVKTRQRLCDHLYSAAFDRLAQDYVMVAHPGPATMRVRLAITDAVGATLELDTITDSMPALRTLEPVADFHPDDAKLVGDAAVECEIVDSQSGRRLLAAVAQKMGREHESTFEKWHDVDDAIDTWADLLRARLTKLRGGDSSPIGAP